MTISQQKLDEFQGRMSNWVASQGLLFQLTHGGSIQGAHSSFGIWFARMAFRLLVLAAMVLLLLWGYLVKRVDFSWFRAELNESIASGLGADETTAGGIARTRGHLEIAQMELAGGERSFFSKASLRGIRTKMGLLDGVLGPWAGETVFVDELIMEVRSGAETDELGREMFEGLFKSAGKFRFSRFEVGRAEIGWGYSGVTRGLIKDAAVQATRKESGWDLVVTGGMFSQNWLQSLVIERMEIEIRPSGVEIREAKLKRGYGEVEFKARVEGPVSRPALSGSGTFRTLSIDSYLAPEVREFLGAELSGTFVIGGSPYASSGVTFNADIKLEAEEGVDRVELRDRLPLLQAISVVDRDLSYKKVRFVSGGFKLETGGGVAVLEEISLKAPDVMWLEGEFFARQPTKEEVDEALNPTKKEEDSPKPEGSSDPVGSDPELAAPVALTLREAAKAAREEGTESSTIDTLLMDAKFGINETSRYSNEARDREQRTPRLDGKVRIGVSAKAFERAPELAKLYPISRENGWRWIEVPLKGSIYGIDREISEQILKLSGSER